MQRKVMQGWASFLPICLRMILLLRTCSQEQKQSWCMAYGLFCLHFQCLQEDWLWQSLLSLPMKEVLRFIYVLLTASTVTKDVIERRVSSSSSSPPLCQRASMVTETVTPGELLDYRCSKITESWPVNPHQSYLDHVPSYIPSADKNSSWRHHSFWKLLSCAGAASQEALWLGLAACFSKECSLARSELLEVVKLLIQHLPEFPRMLHGELCVLHSEEDQIKDSESSEIQNEQRKGRRLWMRALTCLRHLSREEVKLYI